MTAPDVTAAPTPHAPPPPALLGASAGVAPVFEHQLAGFGRFWLRPLRMPEDIPTVHAWVSGDHAPYWGLRGKSVREVEAAYVEIARDADVFLGYVGEAPAFLIEIYDPRRHAVGERYEVLAGDRGMHVLVAPPTRRVPGFSWAVFRTVMDFLFADPAVLRVVVEPAVGNAKIHALNRRAGFRYGPILQLPTKLGHLATCTRAQYRAALERQERRGDADADAGAEAGERAEAARIAHLAPEPWAAANRALVRKAISELAHERLLAPRLLHGEGAGGAWSHYALATDRPEIEYRFRARVLALEHWDLDAASIEKLDGGRPAPLDALALILELREQLALGAAMLPIYLEEITSTLYAAAYKRTHERAAAPDLVHAGFQELEAAMTEGHPVFIANSGRVGFDVRDYLAYAPEAAAPVRLVWLAAHRRRAQITVAADLSYERLIDEELGEEVLGGFHRALAAQGLDPADYLLLPVHPWQWVEKLAIVFAADLAARDLVCLGHGPDTYRAQQSIRTFWNASVPGKRYVKTALSVLNMGFLRGLSADYMRNTPAINDWIHALLESDPYFAEQGFGILREVAGIGYRNAIFEAALPKASPYRKMLAALWRESPVPRLRPGQRLMTMAALLHRDRDGAALLPLLVRASGLGVDGWLDRYLGCYLAPILHCLIGYDLAFMPHGENVILVLEDHAPVGAFMKDIAEEAAIMDPAREVPEDVRRICVSVPDELKVLSIMTDVFDNFLRYAGQILLEAADYPEARFWARVAACIHAYGRRHPELAEKLARHDLFQPEFRHSCLNRLQLRNNQQMVDLADPAGSLMFAGTLRNPIAGLREPAAPAEPAEPVEPATPAEPEAEGR